MVKLLIGNLLFRTLKVQKISQKFVGMVGFPAISPNYFIREIKLNTNYANNN